MGQQSQHNTPPNKSALKRATKQQAKGARITMFEHESAPRPCRRCLNIKAAKVARDQGTTLPAEYKKGHDLWCPENSENKAKNLVALQASQKAMMERTFRCASTAVTSPNHSNNPKQPPAAAVVDFPLPTNKKQMVLCQPKDKGPWCLSKILSAIKKHSPLIEQWFHTANNESLSWRPSIQVGAAIHYLLLDVLPSNFEKKSNKMIGAKSGQQSQWLNQHLEVTGGALYFDIPKHDHREVPDCDYAVVSGCRIWVARWELLWDNLQLKCPHVDCCGKLIHVRFPFLKQKGIAVSESALMSDFISYQIYSDSSFFFG